MSINCYNSKLLPNIFKIRSKVGLPLGSAFQQLSTNTSMSCGRSGIFILGWSRNLKVGLKPCCVTRIAIWYGLDISLLNNRWKYTHHQELISFLVKSPTTQPHLKGNREENTNKCKLIILLFNASKRINYLKKLKKFTYHLKLLEQTSQNTLETNFLKNNYGK